MLLASCYGYGKVVGFAITKQKIKKEMSDMEMDICLLHIVVEKSKEIKKIGATWGMERGGENWISNFK